ncbi:dUTP diphosphatase [Paenisporosarcina cavernae]|uniref:dUTPase n=1 Tax=Paenisporosarcina cavernae TaxID=2320858 RepID=A0A385YU28_9BACL|nr:dUTP diphosphatase [Paenisporosarcina cavernae]AYC29810.1 dUTPase [Paenisporosarcina cavernae]
MDLKQLFDMQKELDAYIQQNRAIQEDVFQKKGLALLVELAELANETRCFKFWSSKGPSDREIVLEEYVDSIHFILSLGIEKSLDKLTAWPKAPERNDLTNAFLLTQQAIISFIQHPTKSQYEIVWAEYVAIANLLHFSYDDVIEAYKKKNEKNYERQQTNY